MASSSPFAGRKLDQIWFWFCVIHIPITLLVDLQALYPPWLIASTPLPGFMKWYLAYSRDPVVAGAMKGGVENAWLVTFFWIEAVFQIPTFVVSAIGLRNNDKRVYPLLLAYGASTATTVLPIIVWVLHPECATPQFTPAELNNLLGSFVPFFLIPLGIALDMGWRLVGIVNQVEGRKRV